MSEAALARTLAINDVAASMLRGASAALAPYDEDPAAREILLAAFAVAIHRIDARLYPGFLPAERRLLWPPP